MMIDTTNQDDSYDGLPPPALDLNILMGHDEFLLKMDIVRFERGGILEGTDSALCAHYIIESIENALKRRDRYLPADERCRLRSRAERIRGPLVGLFPRLGEKLHAARGHDALLRAIDQLALPYPQREPRNTPTGRETWRRLRVLRNLCDNLHLTGGG